MSHLGEQGGGWVPLPCTGSSLVLPHQLGFRPKKGRKEAAGRPCPAPRTQGWGDRDTREETLALEQKMVLLQLTGRGRKNRSQEAPKALL